MWEGKLEWDKVMVCQWVWSGIKILDITGNMKIYKSFKYKIWAEGLYGNVDFQKIFCKPVYINDWPSQGYIQGKFKCYSKSLKLIPIAGKVSTRYISKYPSHVFF